MLIINKNQLLRAGVASLEEPYPSCCQPLSGYPLILSEEAEQKVYHAACAVQLATEIVVDVFTFFHPPAPCACLFTLTVSPATPHQEGGNDAINGS
ncbi:hypothetical protein [Dictyobacter formicarum]|uniref:Uncharacterized protein n=1 Tax=Dictyobacter formicarum TaxID=2778368 RepID=A0ABQ3V9M8_9CHLR|nr:hypothetical protein [Dictyobacter formicarum]GHO82373.1 hypothetical protein KSZ_03790 [Dictyobacter formicarum]